MRDRRTPELRNGWPQSMTAVLTVTAAAIVIVASSWTQSQTAGRIAIAGVVVFVIALILGSGYLVGLTTVPILGAALITTGRGDDPDWIRAAVVGVLWYLAAELAWDAIERRDGMRRTAAYNNRRIDEITNVVLLALAVTVAVVLLARGAPVRTLFVLAFSLLGIAATFGAAAQRLRRSGGEEASPTPGPKVS